MRCARAALGRPEEAEAAFRRAWELVTEPAPASHPTIRVDIAKRIALFYGAHPALRGASDPDAALRAAIESADAAP